MLASHDPGEKPLEGGELWTRYGKGVYIFTAYAWFRQLPGRRAGRVPAVRQSAEREVKKAGYDCAIDFG